MKRMMYVAIAIFLVSSMISAVAPSASAAPITGKSYLAMTRAGRVQVVTTLIDGAKASGVKIKQTPVSYCKRLDEFFIKHPEMENRDLAVILKTLIIMEYDWTQKGVDKDELARQFLGEKLYQQNKTRLKKP